MKRHVGMHELERIDDRDWRDPRAHESDRASSHAAWRERHREADRLNAVIEDLRSSLEKTNRRLNRLLGERKQLAALLDKRDGQLQDLNRELGARTPCASATTGTGGSWYRFAASFSPVASWLARGKAMLRPPSSGVRPLACEAQTVPRTESGRAPLVAHQKSKTVRPVLAVVIAGLDQEQISQLLPVIEKDCSSLAMMPVCITDDDGFEQLRERNMIFEYLPPAVDRDRFDAALPWDLYLQRRLALIRKKWQPVRIVAFGNDAMKLINLWHGSPFEETPIPAAMLPSSIKLG